MPSPRPAAALDRELVQILERAFAHHTREKDEAGLTAEELQRALGLRNPYFATRLLAVLDVDRDGVVRKEDFLAGVRALIAGTDREKLLFAFRIHDHDGDGSLDRDELLRMIAIGLAESESTERATQTAEQLVDALLREGDRNRDGRLSFEELEQLVSRRPHLLAKMVRSEAIWIAPNEELLHWLDQGGADERRAPFGKAPFVVVALFFAANVAVFAGFFGRGLVRGQDPLMQAGRALGNCLDLSGALVLVPMMRRLLTKVRASVLGKYLPIDESIEFHKIVGHTMFALAVAHVAVMIAAVARGHSALERMLFGTPVGLTGTLLFAVFVLMWVCSLSFIRRSSRFELFYFTHLLYVAWLGLAIAHAPTFLFWAGVPLLGFAIEQVVRLVRRGRPSAVVSSRALRSGVTALEIARPKGFAFSPGDYVFLRIPEVARHEWHPFTISSAPERESLGFHVRSLGNWTGALRRLVEKGENASLTAHVDGPYGSPSAHIFQAKHAVLIGAGIGVTPFASVLESLVLRGNGASDRRSNLESADFFWLNRDQYSFEWFAALLRDLERADTRGMLQIHLCMTGASGGATALGFELAREVMRSGGRSDFYTGLRTHTHVGVPDWEKLLGAVARQHQPAPVDVFFCGPPGLANKLRPICARLGMTFREERF